MCTGIRARWRERDDINIQPANELYNMLTQESLLVYYWDEEWVQLQRWVPLSIERKSSGHIQPCVGQLPSKSAMRRP